MLFLETEHREKVPQAGWCFFQVNKRLALLGRVEVPEAMREALLGIGFPLWQAEGLLEDYAHYRRGEAAAVTAGVRDAIGKAPRPFEEFARDHASMFS